MAEIVLDRSRVMAGIRQGKAARMARRIIEQELATQYGVHRGDRLDDRIYDAISHMLERASLGAFNTASGLRSFLEGRQK